jgi:hypothetical protein
MRTRQYEATNAVIILIGALCIFCASSALSEEVIFYGNYLFPVQGGSCEPGQDKILAGSLITVLFENRMDELAEPRKPGWPEGYSLEATLDLEYDKEFIPTPGLIERMNPQLYINGVNQANELMLDHLSDKVNLSSFNRKYFMVQIPRDLAGHSLSIRARYRVGADITSRPTSPVEIIAPCNKIDEARIIGSRMYIMRQTEGCESTLALADSMLGAGLADAMALQIARQCASGAKKYEKSLEYLDRMYEDFGVVDVMLFTSEPPVYCRGEQPESWAQQAYENRRTELMILISNQKQQ